MCVMTVKGARPCQVQRQVEVARADCGPRVEVWKEEMDSIGGWEAGRGGKHTSTARAAAPRLRDMVPAGQGWALPPPAGDLGSLWGCVERHACLLGLAPAAHPTPAPCLT